MLKYSPVILLVRMTGLFIFKGAALAGPLSQICGLNHDLSIWLESGTRPWLQRREGGNNGKAEGEGGGGRRRHHSFRNGVVRESSQFARHETFVHDLKKIAETQDTGDIIAPFDDQRLVNPHHVIAQCFFQ